MGPASVVCTGQLLSVRLQPLEDFRTGTVAGQGGNHTCHYHLGNRVILLQFMEQPVRIHHVTVDDDGRGGILRRDGIIAGGNQRARIEATCKGGAQAWVALPPVAIISSMV